MRKAALILAVALATIYGCKTTETNDVVVIENGQTVTNTVPMKAFSSETYIWETWFFSTNKVEKTK